MATTTVNSRTFLDPSYTSDLGEQRLYRHTLTLEQDNSSGALTLALDGAAVTAVAPATDTSLVTITAGSASAKIQVQEFHALVARPTGVASGQSQPPAGELRRPWEGWAIARLIQLGVSLDTILRIGARFI